jgi:hypothetical protein
MTMLVIVTSITNTMLPYDKMAKLLTAIYSKKGEKILCISLVITVLRFSSHCLMYKTDFQVTASCLGGGVLSVLSTGPEVCEFELGQGNAFLSVIKICTTPSSHIGSKAGRSHVVRFYSM